LKGLDSSLLLRYILEDDPIWSAPATRFIDSNCTRESPGYINSIVLAEVVWSLRRQAGYDNTTVASLVDELLQSDIFLIENEDAVESALAEFKKGKAGFVDCLIAAVNRRAEAHPTFAIDKAAIKSNVFAAISQEQP
jgi:predicted nucleic-acid-binding protein